MTSVQGECALAVFARAPVPGEAKTRLIPLLGAEGAAALHVRLVERMLATANARAKLELASPSIC